MTDLDLMEVGPAAMARSPAAREEAEVIIRSYLRSMDSEIGEERCRQITQRVSRLLGQRQPATAGNAPDDDLAEHKARLCAIAAIFDEEQLPPFFE